MRNPLPAWSEGGSGYCLSVCLCVFLLSFFMSFCFFCCFLCCSNHSPTPALMSICNKMCKHRAKANKQPSHSRRTDYIGLCDPLNCAEEGLRNNCWSSQLSAVWRPQRAKFLRLNLSFLQQQEVGYKQWASVKGVSVLQLLDMFWA